MSKRLIALSVGAMSIAAFTIGCGGGDDEVSTSSITKAEFIAKADAICKRSDKQVEKKFTAFLKENPELLKGAAASEADITAGSTEVVETILLPATRREIKQIDALEVPSGDEDQIDEIIDALEEAVVRSEEDPPTALLSNVEVFRRSKGLSEEYGLKVCGY